MSNSTESKLKRKSESEETDQYLRSLRSLRFTKVGRLEIYEDENLESCARYIPNVFGDHRKLYKAILSETKPEQGMVNNPFKHVMVSEPRLTCVHGDDTTKTYKYSGKTEKVRAMTPVLNFIRDKIQELLKPKLPYDFVLINYYRDGNDYVSLHSDDEKELDEQDIVSISLGAERTFRMMRNADGKWVFNKKLESGSALHMYGKCQRLYKHTVPKELRVTEGRINLTFRRFVS